MTVVKILYKLKIEKTEENLGESYTFIEREFSFYKSLSQGILKSINSLTF